MLGSTCADGSPRHSARAWRPPGSPALALTHHDIDQHLDRHWRLRRVIERVVAPAFAVRCAALWAATRGRPPEAFARQVAMYLAHIGFGLSISEVARLFARDRSTVAHACARIEDRRDAAPFDRSLDLLEGALRLVTQCHS
jgi:chromosomal replication initiation ATPase DnaA